MGAAQLHSLAARKDRRYYKRVFFVPHNYNRNVQAVEPYKEIHLMGYARNHDEISS